MDVGLYYLINPGNSWNMSNGVADTLQRMGHKVTVAVHERGERPTEEWSSFDFTLVLEAEYLPVCWDGLKCPVALWFTETENREDLRYDYASRLASTPYCFFVGIQDAEKYGKTWLPHGVDTQVFKPYPGPKIAGIGCYGSLYPKRLPLWEAINKAKIPIYPIARVDCERRYSFELLARSISSCRAILALPSYSHSFTTRPTEAMACGVPICVPYLEPFARGNEKQWVNWPPCYYKPDSLDSLMEAIISAYCLKPADILDEIISYHRLEIRLQKIIDEVTNANPK